MVRAPLFLQALLCALFVVASGMAAAAADGPTAFPIERLNAGLPPAPEALDRSTPQATLEAFLRGSGPTRAHLLDLAAVPEGEQAARGAALADQLATIVNRKLRLDLAGIPDRPDGMDAVGSSREPMVGVPRKSLSLGQLDLADWPVSVRLNRVVVGEGAPVWVFSRQTVEHIPALYARYGPTPLEEALPAPLRTEAFAGLLWWEVIAVPLIAIVAILLGVALYRVISVAAQRMPTAGLQKAVKTIRLPSILIVLAVLLNTVVTNTFVFSAGVAASLSTVFWLLVLVALVAGASRVLDVAIDQTSNRYLDTIDDPQNTDARKWYTNLSAAKRLGVMAVLVLGLAAALSSLNVFSTFGLSLLVSAGVATAVFGFAAQAILGNIFASLQLAIAKPIRIGDAIYYDDHWAYVERINYTFVQLRTWDQKRYIVPVKNFVSNAFENWTKADPQMIMPVALKLDHTVDVALLRQTFQEFAAEDPDWSEGADPKVLVIGQDEDGITVRFYCTADNPTAAWNLHCRVRERMVARLRELDEPSGWPRTRLARVADTTDRDVGAPRTDTGAINETTGEPRQDALRAAE
ncbi:MAG: mechanosensitive ion channel domain-containing protein [Pseudomonadota bacterium]